jgi:hypothetical protein
MTNRNEEMSSRILSVSELVGALSKVGVLFHLLRNLFY